MITKELDKSSPLLHQALTTGERSDIELKFFRTTSTGAEEHYYTIKLEDALVISINHLSLNDSSDKKYEEVSFSYDKITWTWEPEGLVDTQTAPFSITIKPKEASVSPGDTIKYNMRIDAQEGFEEPIDLSLEVKSLVYSKKHDPIPNKLSFPGRQSHLCHLLSSK